MIRSLTRQQEIEDKDLKKVTKFKDHSEERNKCEHEFIRMQTVRTKHKQLKNIVEEYSKYFDSSSNLATLGLGRANTHAVSPVPSKFFKSATKDMYDSFPNI